MCDRKLLQEGFLIALNYFNYEEGQNITKLTTKAHMWCTKYYGSGKYWNKKGAEALRRTYPEVFNLSVEPSLRLVRVKMTSEKLQVPEGATLMEIARAERKHMNTEPFPTFSEPLMASEELISEATSPRFSEPKGKPKMRVKAETLREAGLDDVLPEFISQLAYGIPQHESFAVKKVSAEDMTPVQDEDDGYESDGSILSTSTAASVRAKLGKRKASETTGAEDSLDAPRPYKVRLDLQWYPPTTLSHFDFERNELISVDNPEHLAQGPDSFTVFQAARKAAAIADEEKHEAELKAIAARESSSEAESEVEDDSSERPVSPSLTAISSISSGSSKRMIKIKVPGSKTVSRESTPASSPPLQADAVQLNKSPAPSRIIKINVKNPHASPPTRSTTASSTMSRSLGIIKIKVPPRSVRSPSLLQLTALEQTASTSSQDRLSSAGTDVSSTSSKPTRIKLINRPAKTPTSAAKVAEWRKKVE